MLWQHLRLPPRPREGYGQVDEDQWNNKFSPTSCWLRRSQATGTWFSFSCWLLGVVWVLDGTYCSLSWLRFGEGQWPWVGEQKHSTAQRLHGHSCGRAVLSLLSSMEAFVHLLTTYLLSGGEPGTHPWRITISHPHSWQNQRRSMLLIVTKSTA